MQEMATLGGMPGHASTWQCVSLRAETGLWAETWSLWMLLRPFAVREKVIYYEMWNPVRCLFSPKMFVGQTVLCPVHTQLAWALTIPLLSPLPPSSFRVSLSLWALLLTSRFIIGTLNADEWQQRIASRVSESRPHLMPLSSAELCHHCRSKAEIIC